jgi:cysteine sulfinate desulfinase/cysteine desulfurase-like protein
MESVNTTYGSIERTVQYLSDVPPHPTASQFTITFPTTPAAIIIKFREHLRALPRPEGKKVVAMIDSIVSTPGVLMPWQEMVKVCKDENVWSVIDAAHSIGQEPNINLSEAQPDFWVSVRSLYYLRSYMDRGD